MNSKPYQQSHLVALTSRDLLNEHEAYKLPLVIVDALSFPDIFRARITALIKSQWKYAIADKPNTFQEDLKELLNTIWQDGYATGFKHGEKVNQI